MKERDVCTQVTTNRRPRLYAALRKKVIVDTFIADINYGRLCNVHLFLLLSPVKSQIDG